MKNINKKGFTFIEILVVLGMIGLILVAVVGALSGTFKAQTRVDLSDKVVQNGNWALEQIKRSVLNADGKSIVCDVGGSSVTFNNASDGNSTTIVCVNNKIASESSNRADLTSLEVLVTGCSGFVTCSPVGSNAVNSLSFNFNLAIGDTDSETNFFSKEFDSSITVRN